MARMIPSFGPMANASYTAEPTIYRALAEQLPDDFTVIHSLSWLGQIASEIDGRPVPTGEIDFLILHPKLGMLAIEVKGGALKYERYQFVVLRSGKMIDPITQVRRGTHTLARWIRGSGGPAYRIGYALAFPESDMQRRLIPPALVDMTTGKPESICIDRPSLSRCGERVVEIMQYWRQAMKLWELTQSQIDKVVDLLCPVVDYSPRWSDRIEEDTARWLLLTPEQTRRLEQTAQHQRVVLTGRSGTGKTLLASARARQLTEQGKRVLFLVYNAPLAVQLRSELKETAIEVFNFHQLCRQAAVQLGLTEDIDSEDWYKVKAPQALATAIRSKRLAPYDALVIDEAQVFHADWLSTLEQWFTDKPVLACCDWDDALVFSFEERTSLQELVRIMRVKEAMTLTVNMRSPRAVFELLREALPTPYEQVSFRNSDPDVLVEYTDFDPLDRLHKVIRQLHEEGIAPQSILVVYTEAEPSYQPGVELMVGRTISAYKVRGIESPVVIVWSDCSVADALLACAYTRATSRCIAIYPIQRLLPGAGGSSSAEGVFYQHMKNAAKDTLALIWPPQKKFSLTPAVTNSADIAWSHDWGGWLMNSISHYEDGPRHVSEGLWGDHLLSLADAPIYRFVAVERFIRRYTPSHSLVMEYFSLRWCDQCQWWARIASEIDDKKEIGDSGQVRYYCLDCLEGKKSALAPDVLQNLVQWDQWLVDPSHKLDVSGISIFLVALKIWYGLTDEQRQQLAPYVGGVEGRTGFGVSKILAGMNLVRMRPGQIVDAARLSDYYWQKCSWLAQHISQQDWHKVMVRGTSIWITHKWLEKVDKGVYRRLPTPP